MPWNLHYHMKEWMYLSLLSVALSEELAPQVSQNEMEGIIIPLIKWHFRRPLSVPRFTATLREH